MRADARARAQAEARRKAELTANPLVHADDGPYSESADGKSGVHPGWWAAAFLLCAGFWLWLLW